MIVCARTPARSMSLRQLLFELGRDDAHGLDDAGDLQHDHERIGRRGERNRLRRTLEPGDSTCSVTEPGATASNENVPSTPVRVVRGAAPPESFSVTTAALTVPP